ncbi:hypothetical protein [Streptantibioticus cattleyicolor]|uniref:Uncharacterized protein n=1 Tax=Streptantibioticus cattleyicolor (strain ATCC 35852 / DSM 46488 / JCM 4925 / NBRC 14057 / NRRL 8057) TaxID=1003195 RepID=F8JLC6_STREN|nr:hypothetical protein [Streptantibioticus cattleyicolor]AEW99584.1 hypothetical protein SCATT_p13910 [Streptantibioticus cattleyicolor NRRL 8057 = DSM 46488]CCB71378.1 protein of unknown function [Streptantibioticus cattleyicolor NRRL 8057 = DSM 46488]
MAYRYWCGECGYKTPWVTESEGVELQIEHYAKRHPGIPPGGHVEADRRRPGGGVACLQAVFVIVLLLSFAVSCHHH